MITTIFQLKLDTLNYRQHQLYTKKKTFGSMDIKQTVKSIYKPDLP